MAQPKAKGSKQHEGNGIQTVSNNKNKQQILVSAQTACAYAITDAIALKPYKYPPILPMDPCS